MLLYKVVATYIAKHVHMYETDSETFSFHAQLQMIILMISII